MILYKRWDEERSRIYYAAREPALGLTAYGDTPRAAAARLGVMLKGWAAHHMSDEALVAGLSKHGLYQDDSGGHG